jgi:hypothetical protein
MDEKTAELRDIFLETTGEETVKERGGAARGSLADVTDPDRVDARLRDLVATMRERYDFETGLDEDDYVRVIRGFFGGEDDATVAEALGVDAETVSRARLDCHLVDERDRDLPAFAAIRDRLDAADGADEPEAQRAADERVAAALEGEDPRSPGNRPETGDGEAEEAVDAETVARVRRVLAAERRATRASGRFRDAFAELLTDGDLGDRLASDSREDGLREATEDIETDVSF